MKLPVKTNEFINNYMIPSTRRSAPLDMMVLALYMQTSEILCWNRVKVINEQGKLEFPMLYAFNFAKSGAYKDQVIDVIKETTAETVSIKKFEVKQMRYAEMMDSYKLEVAKETKAEDKKAVPKPKKFNDEIKGGSIQGLQSHRINASKMGVGHVHYSNSEFLDRYSTKDSNLDEFFASAKDAWSKGDTNSDIVISEMREDVRGVPFTFLLHGSSDSLKDNPKVYAKFKSILSTGIAKRSIVLYNNHKERAILSNEDMDHDNNKADEYRPLLEKHFNKIYDAVSMYKHNSDGTKESRFDPIIIKLSSEAKGFYRDYYRHVTESGRTERDPIVCIETLDRHWRAFRLAACIAVFEHPEDLTIKGEDFLFALNLTERWGTQFKEFLEGTFSETKADRLYSYILANPGCKKTTSRRAVGIRDNREFESCMDIVRDITIEEGLLLEEIKGNRNAFCFSIIPIPEDKEIEDIKIKISVADHNSRKIAKGFKLYERDFSVVYRVFNSNFGYTPCSYKDGYRSNKNVLGGETLLILDIDNDGVKGIDYLKEEDKPYLSFDECKDLVKDYKCMLVKTKSSGKSITKDNGDIKNPLKHDRYRVVFPITEAMTLNTEDYSRLKKSLANKFGLTPYWDQAASVDKARFYYGAKGDYWYSDSNLVLNWKTLDYKEDIIKNTYIYKPKQTGGSTPTGYTKLESNTVLSLKGGKTITANEAKQTATDKSVPCKCPNPAHKDTNASAFYCLTNKGNFLINCSGCGGKFII